MSVVESWSSILAWCHQHAPKALVDLQPPGETSAEEMWAGAGLVCPRDLVELYQLTGGADFEGHMIFRYSCPLTPALMIDGRASMTEVWDEIRPADSAEHQAAITSSAGEVVADYLPAFLPIAGNLWGDFIMVDLRLGELNGSAFWWGQDTADTEGPRWKSVTDLLQETAESFSAGTPCRGMQPIIDPDGEIDWKWVK